MLLFDMKIFFFFCIYQNPKWCDALDMIRYNIIQYIARLGKLHSWGPG